MREWWIYGGRNLEDRGNQQPLRKSASRTDAGPSWAITKRLMEICIVTRQRRPVTRYDQGYSSDLNYLISSNVQRSPSP